MPEEGSAEVLEMVPGGIGRDESCPEVLAGMVVDCEQKGLLGVGSPPRVDRGVMLPEFADAEALPAPSGLGHRKWLQDEVWEVRTRISSDGFAIPVEGKSGGELVSDELKIWRALEGQEGLKEALNFGRPAVVVIATGDVQDEARSVLKPGEADAKQMCPTNGEEFTGIGGIKSSEVE